MKMSKKLFSLVLSAVLVLTLIPAASFAASTGETDPNFSFTVNGGTEDVVVSPGETVTVRIAMDDEMTVSAWTGGITCSDVEILRYDDIKNGAGGNVVSMGYLNDDSRDAEYELEKSDIEEANESGNVGFYIIQKGIDRAYRALGDGQSEVVVTLKALQTGDVTIFGYEDSDGTDGVEMDEITPVTVKVRQKAEIDFDFDVPVELEVGSVFDGGATLTAGDALALTYESDNPAVAEVDPVTGEVTAVALGTAVITVSAPASMEYQAVTASYTVIVKEMAKGSVGGTITSYLAGEGDITVQLMSGDEVAYSTVVNTYEASGKGFVSEYSFAEVEDGEYTLTVGKQYHVTREYDVTVSGGEVAQDAAIYLLGDVTMDGVINIGDHQRLFEHLQGIAPITDVYQKKLADTTTEGTVNIGDHQRLFEHLQGIDSLTE